MALKATTIKLEANDEQVIEALREKHGIKAMVDIIRFSLTYTLLNAPPKKKPKKVSSFS